MKQINKFSDSRLDGCCIYCGGKPETRDHVPSKILIDNPFPKNLPVVPACDKCNKGFSQDEEYFACLLGCVLSGSTEPDDINRKKIKTILIRKHKLRARLEKAKVIQGNQTFFQIEEDRVNNVILKLAKGHATYENSELQLNGPTSISKRVFALMSEEEKLNYFSRNSELLPEIGSRAFQRLFTEDDNFIDNWIVVQKDKYMYSVEQGALRLKVKFLIWNYLACEVTWD